MRRLTGNRLIQKIRRHGSITTLFRIAAPGLASGRSDAEHYHISAAYRGDEKQIVQAAFVNQRPIIKDALDNLEPERSEISPVREAISTPQRTQTDPNEKAQSTSLPQAQPSIQKQDDREWRRLQAIMKKHLELSTGENATDNRSEIKTNPQGAHEKTPQPTDPTNLSAGKIKRETSESEIHGEEPEKAQKKPEPGSISSGKSVSKPGLQTTEFSSLNRLVEKETPKILTSIDTGSRTQIIPPLIEEATPHSAEKHRSTGASDLPLHQKEADRTSAKLDSDLMPNRTILETGDEAQLPRRKAEGTGEKSNLEKGSAQQPQSVPQMKENRPQSKEESSTGIDAFIEPAGTRSDPTGSGVGQVVSNQQVPISEFSAESMGKTGVAETLSSVPKPDETKKPSIITHGLIQSEQDSIPSKDPIPFEEEKRGLPLEAVWPVSVQNTRPPITEGYLNPSTMTQPTTRQPIEDAAIQQVMSGVEIGSPTDSQVDLIGPRRPRPAARPPKPEGMKVQESLINPGTEQNAPVIQESPLDEKKTTDKKPPAQKSIHTEIGPLPSDLWQLIGLPAPIEQAEPSSIKETAAQKRPENHNKNERTDILQEVTSGTQDHPLLQRQEETPAAPPVASPANEPVNSPGNIQLSNQEKAELSQRVYFEIKRRLAVEWERLRHKR